MNRRNKKRQKQTFGARHKKRAEDKTDRMKRLVEDNAESDDAPLLIEPEALMTLTDEVEGSPEYIDQTRRLHFIIKQMSRLTAIGSILSIFDVALVHEMTETFSRLYHQALLEEDNDEDTKIFAEFLGVVQANTLNQMSIVLETVANFEEELFRLNDVFMALVAQYPQQTIKEQYPRLYQTLKQFYGTQKRIQKIADNRKAEHENDHDD